VKNVGFIYDDIFLKHSTPDWHPESKERLIRIVSTLKESGLWEKVIHIKPSRAIYEDVALVHTHDYITRIEHFGTGYLDSDTYMSEDSLKAAFYAAGAVTEAVERCKKGEIERAFCAVRPPGHHAESDRAMGFCIFNNVAIGVRHAQQEGYKKIFIVDFDVHHGNGTQHIFEQNDTIFYFSTHEYPHYPGTGKSSERGIGRGINYTHNVPMPSGSGDKEYLTVYHDILPPLVKNFEPDIVFVSAGYDIHKNDPLSGIRISDEGIKEIVRNILACAPTAYIFALEGGYNLSALGESVRITIEEMLKDS
jgi:acetoin utilization deacetylase AcuC-like enzyme